MAKGGMKNPQKGTMYGMKLDVEGPWNQGDASRSVKGKGGSVDDRATRDQVGGSRTSAKFNN